MGKPAAPRDELNIDPYTDPDTGCLHNRFGITDPAELADVEHRHAYVEELTLVCNRPELGRFDADHLRAVHRWLFADLYDWAGRFRTVDIAKGNTLFASPRHLHSEAHRIFTELAGRRRLQGLDADAFCAAASDLLADLNALHPFREGNGRTQRVFLQQLANQAGWQFAWAHIDPADNIRLSQAAMVDPEAFTPMLRHIIRPGDIAIAPTDLIARRPPAPPPGLDH